MGRKHSKGSGTPARLNRSRGNRVATAGGHRESVLRQRDPDRAARISIRLHLRLEIVCNLRKTKAGREV
jgi:hypothetical protein